jgi:AraC-like DNA-binding protein
MTKPSLHPLPPQLAAHQVFATSDPEIARAAVTDILSAHELKLVHRSERLRASLHAATVGDVTLSHLTYGAEVEIDASPITGLFSVQLPVSGHAEICCGHEQVVSTPFVASVPTPVERLRMRWERDAAQMIVKVSEPVLMRYLGKLLGHAPRETLRPLLGLDLASAQGTRWRVIHALLLNELDLAAAGQSTAASRAVLEELVMSTLLLTHPNNYSERLRRIGAPAGRRYVRRAMEHAQANLDRALTLGELAEAAGVSARALQDGFREVVGCSPTAWVRDLRLDRARDQLAAAEPGDGTSVTEVALRWGFSHLGRFSQVYGERFGERPSETLRR